MHQENSHQKYSWQKTLPKFQNQRTNLIKLVLTSPPISSSMCRKKGQLWGQLPHTQNPKANILKSLYLRLNSPWPLETHPLRADFFLPSTQDTSFGLAL